MSSEPGPPEFAAIGGIGLREADAVLLADYAAGRIRGVCPDDALRTGESEQQLTDQFVFLHASIEVVAFSERDGFGLGRGRR